MNFGAQPLAWWRIPEKRASAYCVRLHQERIGQRLITKAEPQKFIFGGPSGLPFFIEVGLWTRLRPILGTAMLNCSSNQKGWAVTDQPQQVTKVLEVRKQHIPEQVLLLGFQTETGVVNLVVSLDDAQDLADKLAHNGVTAA